MDYYFIHPVRCLACAEVYDSAGLGELPAPCPKRYLFPHTQEFMTLVAEQLDGMGAIEKPTREQHLAAIKAAHIDYKATVEGKRSPGS